MSYSRNPSYAPQRQSPNSSSQQQKRQRQLSWQAPWQQNDETGHLTASYGQRGSYLGPETASLGSSVSAPQTAWRAPQPESRKTYHAAPEGGDVGTEVDWAHYAAANRYDTAVQPMDTYAPDDSYPTDDGCAPGEGNDVDAISDDYRLVDVISFTEAPEKVICPCCLCEVVTEPAYAIGYNQILLGTFICLFGGVLGCCLIPCCFKGLLDVVHVCPECDKPVGRCRRI